MEKVISQHIDEIRKRMQCSKEFRCAASGFEKLCLAKDVGLKHHLLCLENVPALCEFAVCINGVYYCTCPLRIFLKRNLLTDRTNKAGTL